MDGREANRIANARTRKLDADDAHALERVDTITRNARGIWFGLLGALVFAGVTLLGVEDIDFFGIDRSTKLPLIGVSVPVTYFFAAGAALVSAFYVYFHLYLVQLWEALGKAPNRPNGRALTDTVHPWLVTDAMIRWRSRLRKDKSADKRTLAFVGVLVSFVFVWLFGLLILGYFWWRSMPAHQEWMTLGLGGLLVFAIWVAARSLHSAYVNMRKRDSKTIKHWTNIIGGIALFLLIAIITTFSWLRTEGGFEYYATLWSDKFHNGYENEEELNERHRLAISKIWTTDQLEEVLGQINFIKNLSITSFFQLTSANLSEKNITILPKDWLPRNYAIRWFNADWCKRENMNTIQRQKKGTAFINGISLPCRDMSIDQRKKFSEEWTAHRTAYLSFLSRPKLKGRDLRKANMRDAFLPRIDLRRARLQNADLTGAQLEEANLNKALLQRVTFSLANLQKANLAESQLFRAQFIKSDLHYADFSGAKLQKANFSRASMLNSDLSDAQLQNTTLVFANLQGSNLRNAQLQAANLGQATLTDAMLREAKMQGADLWKTNLQGADLTKAKLNGALFWQSKMEQTTLFKTHLEGALFVGTTNEQLRFKDTDFRGSFTRFTAWSRVDFSNSTGVSLQQISLSFGDSSVLIPERIKRPCHWASVDLGVVLFFYNMNTNYFGRWRGWVEHNGSTWPTSERFTQFKDVTPIPPVYQDGPKKGQACPTIAEMGFGD